MDKKEKIKKLAMETLLTSYKQTDYTEQDLVNATLIFQDVFTNFLYNRCVERKYSEEVSVEYARKAGRLLRGHIWEFTGVDLHKVSKEDL